MFWDMVAVICGLFPVAASFYLFENADTRLKLYLKFAPVIIFTIVIALVLFNHFLSIIEVSQQVYERIGVAVLASNIGFLTAFVLKKGKFK